MAGGIEARVLGLRHRRCPAAHLGHAPGVQHVHVVLLPKASIAGGQAEPPITVRRIVLNFRLLASVTGPAGPGQIGGHAGRDG